MAKDILEVGRQLAESFNGTGGQGFQNVGRKNAYECERCGSYIVTIDRDPGVTPFIVRCGNCGNEATSKFYRVQDWLSPTHEWYRPETLEGVEPCFFPHLEKGGLLLRPVEGWPDAWVTPRSRWA